MFKYIKFKLIVILLTSNLYASQKIEVFYDPFYYEDINKVLVIQEGFVISKNKFGNWNKKKIPTKNSGRVYIFFLFLNQSSG